MSKLINFVVLFAVSILLLSGCSQSAEEETATEGTKLNVSESAARSDNSKDIKTYSLEQLQQDFKLLQSAVGYQPQLYTDKAELNELFDKQYKLLKDGMDEIEFFRIVSPIVSKINCGHTNLNLSSESEEFKNKNGNQIPLLVRIIDDRAYVYKDLSSKGIPEGSEILEINGRKAKDIINVFLSNLTADGSNTSKKYYIMNHWFNSIYYNYIDSPEKFDITYMNSKDSKVQKVTVDSIKNQQIETAANAIQTQSNMGNKMYWQEFEKDYAVLTIRSFGFYDDTGRNDFKAFINSFFKELSDRKVSNLILDVRDNWGGDPYCAAHLYSYLISKKSPYFSADTSFYSDLKTAITPAQNRFKGKLFTLTNGASFSTSGHLCGLLKYHKTGTFIGEETGGSYVCTDASTEITLTNTKLRFRYSTKAFSVAVSGLTPGRGIVPDYPVKPSIQDYLDNKDLEMELAVKLIRR